MLVAAISCCALSVPAQIANPENNPYSSVCQEAVKTPLPAEATKIATPEKWPDCISYRIYSGIGVAKDVVAARRCAWEERLAFRTHQLDPNDGLTPNFGGSAMLAILYANGEGVKRNIPLAIRFACEVEQSQGFSERWLDRLQESEPNDPSNSERLLSFCSEQDDIASLDTCGFMDRRCAAYGAELADQRRKEELRRLTAKWSGAQKAEFVRLTQAQDEYASAVGAYAGHYPESLHVENAINAEEDVQDKFVSDLKQFESGKLPRGSESDYRLADKELNQAFQQTLAKSEADARNNSGTDADKQMAAEDPEYIRNVERAWIKYRDAWVDFARLRYPTVSRFAWLTFLTVDETKKMSDIQTERY